MANPLKWFRDQIGGAVADAGLPALAEVIRLDGYRARRVSAVSSTGGQYDAGGYMFHGEKFSGGLPTSGYSPILDHQYLRRNAREQYHTTPVARAIVERFAETVVDAGLKLEPTPSAEVLGLTREQAGAWSRAVAARFHLWASSKFPHAAEQMTFYQMQRQAEIAQQRDGEFFIRLLYLDDPGRPSPLAMSFVEPDQIVGCGYTSTQGYPWNDSDGITRDERGRETSYQVTVRRGNIWTTETIPAALPNGRRVMIHGWCPEYASQGRGFSRLSHAIQEFEELTGFATAQIQKAIAQSALVMVKETDAGSTPMGSIFGDTAANFAVEDGGNIPPSASNEFGFDPLRVKLSPGGIGIFEGLGAGEKIKSFANTAPSDSFASFTDAFIAHLAASVSMPVEVLLLRFNANYSASRAALVMFWRVARLWRKELESDFLSVVWEMWLAEEIAAGRISARGWTDPVMRLAWLSCEWSGSEMPNIDPKVSVEAARMAIEANLSNFQREARELNGSDAETNKGLNDEFMRGMTAAPWNTSRKVGGGAEAPSNGATNDAAR